MVNAVQFAMHVLCGNSLSTPNTPMLALQVELYKNKQNTLLNHFLLYTHIISPETPSIKEVVMNVREAVSLFRFYQKSNHRKRTIESYRFLLQHFESLYAFHPIDTIKPDEIYNFLEQMTRDLAKSTRRLRYAQLKAFFNFVIEKCSPDMKNPCNSPLLSKTFRMPRQIPKVILDKEIVDEMIYNTKNPRNRLMLELQARCGLRIGELLGLRVSDFSDRKLAINTPKSGKEREVAFMPEHIAKRLGDFIKSKSLSTDEYIFPICCSTARTFIKKLGAKLNIVLSPHDLRRYSATYASRNEVPLEIVSKVILRHQDLKTTQIYLGKVSEHEAIRLDGYSPRQITYRPVFITGCNIKVFGELFYLQKQIL